MAVYKSNQKGIFKMTTLVSMSTIAATVLSGLVLVASPVQAATWTARKPAEIQISKGQKVYTIQWGDTLWAISQRTNITIAKLAQLNGVANPSFIMTGATLTLDWSQAGTATATMTVPDGTVTGQSTIQQQDKVDPAKSVGTTVSGSKVTQAAGQTASSATNEQVQRPPRLSQPVQLLHRHKPRIRILLPVARNQDQRMLIHQVVRIPVLVQ